jgi:hypothetical protein
MRTDNARYRQWRMSPGLPARRDPRGAVLAWHLNTKILLLHSASPSSLLDMSSDPLTDLANSTEAFAREFREFMARNPRPAPGSPADKEALGEPFAGNLG